MQVEFWFDPVCPFCWMTSRWLNDVALERDLEIEWRPISLLFKNNPEPGSQMYDKTERTRNLLRVVESVRAAGHGDRIGDLYTEFGKRIHHQQTVEFEVGPVLESVGLEASHADALDDESFDDAIRSGMQAGLDLTGDEVGTPLIAVTGRSGRVGLFGPVITELPGDDDRLRLWDGFLAMVDTPGFFELKRTRTSAPDLASIHLD